MNCEGRQRAARLILLIAENARERELLQTGFEKEGYSVVATNEAEEGLFLAKALCPELILCDVFARESDNLALLKELRATPATSLVQFILLGEHASPLNARLAMKQGADDFLSKPFSFKEVLEAVNARLHRLDTFMQVADPTKLPRPLVHRGVQSLTPKLQLVFRFIEQNFHQAISLRDVSRAVGYSAAYLTTMLQKETGRTVNEWILEYRMAEARRLLLQGELIHLVSAQVGYQNTCNFIRKFRQVHQLSPRAWVLAQRRAVAVSI